MSFVYLVSNLKNGKRYVGKADDIDTRWNAHLRSARRNEAGPLYRAIRKYGEPNFAIHELEEQINAASAYQAETAWIRLLREAGFELYNLNDGGLGGSNPSPETLEKMSTVKRGKIFSEEHRTNIRRAAKNRPPVSEETKARLREARRRRAPPSEETRKKVSESQSGRKQSLETRRKLSDAARRQWERQKRPASTHQGYAP